MAYYSSLLIKDHHTSNSRLSLCEVLVQMKPIQGLFWAYEKSFKTAPMDAEAGIP
jgi:hypothetical protein